MVEGVAATVTLRIGAGATRVFVKALDPSGKPGRTLPVVLQDGTASFSVSEKYQTIWSQINVD
jgi:hypothetical protein